MQEKRVKLAGGTLVYLDHGEGELLAFFHGGLVTPVAYIPLLTRLGSHFRVLAPTHPGHGASFGLSSYWRLDNFIDTYQEFFRVLNVKPDVLVGHSFGGSLALLLGAKGVGKQLVAVSPTGLPFQLAAKAYTAAKRKEVQELLGYVKDTQRVKEMLSAIGTLFYTATKHPKNVAWLTQRIPTFDVSQQLRNIRVPASLFWGEDDGVVPLSIGKLMQLLVPHANLTVFSRKGHTYPITDPEFTYKELMKVLS